MAASFDRSDILRTWAVFRQPGEVLEMRIPKAGRYKTISGYFDDPGKLADAVIGLADEKFAGIYFTVNPVKQDLLARASNRYTKYAETTTSDADITALHWLPVDLDAKRPAGISSTDGEHEAALTKAQVIRRCLIEEQGWPAGAFVLADSGNGAHLNAKIDLPNLPENVDLVAGCLAALDFLFSDEIVQVDTTSQNPARIWKIYGTMARKGDSTASRPHRLAKLLDVPEFVETISRELLVALAAMLPRPEKTPKNQVSGKGFDPVAYCQAHNLQVHHTKSWTDRSGAKCTVAVLEQCVFNPDHHLSAVIIGWPTGMRSYRCRHNSCLSKHWKDVKALIEPERKESPASCDSAPFPYTHTEANPPMLRANATKFEKEHPGSKIFNCDDDLRVPPENSISEEELEAFKLPDGPKFECRLPKDHFLQRFIAYGTDISDAYPDYWFAGGLYALAVVADKKIKIVLKQGTLYPNLYVSINGKSSLARKSTAVDKTEIIIFKTLPQMLSAMVPTEFSPEAFVEHLSNFQHAPWVRDEAAGVLSLMKKDYMRGFKDSLMQLFDCKPFHRKLRTSQRKGSQTDFNVDDPYLNLLWATTGASLGANTDQTDTLSGFLARFIFFFPQGMKPRFMPLEEGTAEISMFEDLIVSQLRGIAYKMAALKECTALHISPEAAAYYNRWQETREREWITSDDGAAMQIFSRMNPMVVKLGMLFELGAADFDLSKPIRLEFIEEACRLVDEYLMPTSRAVYDLVGASADKNDIDKIIAFLKQHNGKGSRREIMRYVKIKRKDFDDYVAMMVESEMVDEKLVDNKGKGRNPLYLFLRDNAKVTCVSRVSRVSRVPSVPKIPVSESLSNFRDTGDIGANGDVADIGDASLEPVEIGQNPRKDLLASTKRPDPTDLEKVRILAMDGYRTQIPLPGNPNKFADRFYSFGEIIEVQRWKANDLIKRGVAVAVAV